MSWRVAVATQRELMANAEEAFEVKDRTAGAARPAVLSLEVQRADEEEAHHDAHVITLHLWRAEMVAAVVEVDATNHIQRVLPGMFPPGAPPAAGHRARIHDCCQHLIAAPSSRRMHSTSVPRLRDLAVPRRPAVRAADL